MLEKLLGVYAGIFFSLFPSCFQLRQYGDEFDEEDFMELDGWSSQEEVQSVVFGFRLSWFQDF